MSNKLRVYIFVDVDDPTANVGYQIRESQGSVGWVPSAPSAGAPPQQLESAILTELDTLYPPQP